jgi:imidazoleglycerol-phosphate dehydratase
MSEFKRETKETKIETKINLYGKGESSIKTGVGFLDHMLEALSKHSFIDIELFADGDYHIDDHHTVEDVGIVLGTAFAKAIYPVRSIERFGSGSVVMDEALVTCHLDISNRPFLYFDLPIDGKVGNFDVELVEEFFRAFVFNAKITLHISMERGKNRHHIIEASFKALALSLRRALKENSKGVVPSTKGTI